MRPVFALGVRERDSALRTAQMRALADNVRMAKARGLGPTAGWTWSFWCSSLEGFTPMTASDGWVSTTMACPLCPNFRTFAGDYIAEMARTGIDMILLDDDYRYGHLHEPEILCTCPLHLAKIEALLSEKITPAELKQKVLTGGRNRYRDAWMKVNGDALKDFASYLRHRVDAVDPKVRIGLCAVMSHWDNDGVDAATTARILAGGTRPFLRLIGAPYWSVSRAFYDARLQNIVEFTRMERSWISGDDIEVVGEGDTYPRPRTSCPASYLELFDLALRACGETDGLLKYGIDYYKPDSEDGYLVRHRKNRPLAVEVEKNFGGKTAVGLRIYEKMNRLAEVQVPDSWTGTTKIFGLFGSEAAKYCSDLGVPTVWQGEGVAGVAFGPNVLAVSPEARRKGLIVDAWAAWLLQQNGVDVGIRNFGPKYQAGVEKGPFGLGGSTFAYEAYRLTPAENIEVVAFDADGKTPAAFIYRNAAGEKYMVLPHETYYNNPSWHRTYKAGRMLVKGVKRLTGRSLPAFAEENVDVYVQAKDGLDGSRAVGVFNMSADELVDQVVTLDRSYDTVRFINCTGRLDGSRVILEHVPAWSFAGFELKGLEAFDPRMAVERSVVTNGVRWIDGLDLPMEGRAFNDVDRPYDRLPSNVTTNVNEGVRTMKSHTAGLQVRFVTDSSHLNFTWIPLNEKLSVDHMPATGVSGIDIYRLDSASGQWRYLKTGRITDARGGSVSVDWKPGEACLVNFPLYNGIKEFKIGLDETATVSVPPPHRSGVTKPVVFYGTSITHGGCCSRPGLAFVNIVGRDLDVPVVNLGFSGSGRMELEMSDHLARIDASCYVLDCLWNMDEAMVEARFEPFVRNLRAKRPNVPIVFAEQCDVWCGPPCGKDKIIRRIFDKLKSEGWKGLVYLPKTNMYSGDAEGTVDGCHPNDLGMASVARAFGVAVREALNLR